MTTALPDPPLLVITDRRAATCGLLETIDAALSAGCRWFMLREKDLDRPALAELAATIVPLCRRDGASVVINGDITLAAATGAAGVHVQSAQGVVVARDRLGASALIGVSCHDIDEIHAAAAAGADYATLSPIFLTDSKPGYGPAIGIDGLAEACASCRIPVLALAGVSPQNTGDCLAAGAAGIAVMGGVMRSNDPQTVTASLIGALREHAASGG